MRLSIPAFSNVVQLGNASGGVDYDLSSVTGMVATFIAAADGNPNRVKLEYDQYNWETQGVTGALRYWVHEVDSGGAIVLSLELSSISDNNGETEFKVTKQWALDGSRPAPLLVNRLVMFEIQAVYPPPP